MGTTNVIASNFLCQSILGCAGESQSPDSSSLHLKSGLRLGLSKRAKLKPLHPTVEMS